MGNHVVKHLGTGGDVTAFLIQPSTLRSYLPAPSTLKFVATIQPSLAPLFSPHPPTWGCPSSSCRMATSLLSPMTSARLTNPLLCMVLAATARPLRRCIMSLVVPLLPWPSTWQHSSNTGAGKGGSGDEAWLASVN